MKMFNHLSVELKLEVLTRISESIRKSINKKEASNDYLIDELYGSWEDMDDGIEKRIYERRSIARRNINLD